MILFAIQMLSLVSGLWSLISGSYRINRKRVATGPAARAAGLVLASAFPTSFLLCVLAGVIAALGDYNMVSSGWLIFVTCLDWGTTFLVIGIAQLIALRGQVVAPGASSSPVALHAGTPAKA